MKEKINLASKIKDRVLVKNLSLNSLKKLPPEIFNKLSDLLKNFMLLHEGKLYKPEVRIIDEKTLLLKPEGLPVLNNNEVLLLILPFSEIRYIFIAKVTNIEHNGYTVTFMDPRSEERLPIEQKIPAFLSLIPQQFIRELIQNPAYQLLRESNATVDNYHLLEEIHIYDLILDDNHHVEEKFKKFIQKTLFVGEILDISKGGLAVKIPSKVQLDDEFNVFYVKFTFSQPKILKFALFSHLRNISQLEGGTIFHFSFLTGLNPELWNLIKGDLEKLKI